MPSRRRIPDSNAYWTQPSRRLLFDSLTWPGGRTTSAESLAAERYTHWRLCYELHDAPGPPRYELVLSATIRQHWTTSKVALAHVVLHLNVYRPRVGQFVLAEIRQFFLNLRRRGNCWRAVALERSW
jgi:hypothetical protein